MAWKRHNCRWKAACAKDSNGEAVPLIDPALLQQSRGVRRASRGSSTGPADQRMPTLDSTADLLIYSESPQTSSPCNGSLPKASGPAAAARAVSCDAAAADERAVAWVGALLPALAIDAEGQFSFVLAKVVDSLAGCSQLVVRGRRRANAAQLVEDLKLEVARRAVEADLPAQASVVCLAQGSMLVQGKKIVLACSSCCPTTELLCASLSSVSLPDGAPNTAPTAAGGSERSHGSQSSSSCQSLVSRSASGSAAPGAYAAEGPPLPNDVDGCAAVARLLYEWLPFDFCITRAQAARDA